MSDIDQADLNGWLDKKEDLTAALEAAFIDHAINNRGILTSTRRAHEVAAALVTSVTEYFHSDSDSTIINKIATDFAEQGMAMVTGQALMLVLAQTAVTQPSLLLQTNQFQLQFMQSLANARELIQHRVQEKSQIALQRALHTQLEQQILLNEGEKQRNEHLNHILHINARLNQISDTQTLLVEAANGINRSLALSHVVIYEYFASDSSWKEQANTKYSASPSSVPPETLKQLDNLLRQRHEITRVYQTESGDEGISAAILLRTGQMVLGALVVQNDHLGNYSHDSFLILLRTFAQNLASLWHNLHLLTETQHRAKELEILHGRYIDNLWRTEQSTIEAHYRDQNLQIERGPTQEPVPQLGVQLPLNIGEEIIGQIQLPEQESLTPEANEFVSALVHEMSSALNNARFLQTAHAYSNQLNVAANVSRAATTILDRDQLIQEVVELIRNRFDYYYVGLFLVDTAGKTAVLAAGTGEAGKRQLEQNHHHPVNTKSMVGNAISTGQTHVEQDVTQAVHFRPNPLLPDTRSEIALPLHIRGRVIGALTVQSVERGAFPNDTVAVLQNLADQLAIAIENASLFARTEENLAQTKRLYTTVSQMTEAQTENEVFQMLIDFAAGSGLVDLANIITIDTSNPDYLQIPVQWQKNLTSYSPNQTYLRDEYPFSEQLALKQFIEVEDGQTDPQLDEATRQIYIENQLHTTAHIRIYNKNNWFGSLTLIRKKIKKFTIEEMQPFFTLVEQAAIILSNLQLLKQTETLYKIGSELNQIIARDDALNMAVKEIAAYTGAPQCRFVLYNKRTKSGVVAAEAKSNRRNKHFIPTDNDFVYEKLSQTFQPLLLHPDDENIPAEAIATHVTPFGATTSLLTPAASQHDLIGYLAIDSHRGTRPFNPNNITFTQTAVDLLTTQLENIKLFDEALQRAQELITLNQIQSNITKIINITDLAQTIHKQIGQLLDHTIFTMATFNPETNLYTPVFCNVEDQIIATKEIILTEDHPILQVFHENKHIVANAEHPITHSSQGCKLNNGKIQSGLWMPLHKDNIAIGLISLQSYWSDAYDDNDIQLLRSITTQVSLVLANVDLFTKIQAQNDELVQLDELKNQFLANMSHELRTPLNSIIGFSRVILKGIDGPITREQEEDLSSIYHNGQHLLTLINEILDMAKIEAGKMALTYETTELLPVMESVYKTVRGLIDPEKIELVWDVAEDLPPIEADSLRVRQILLNLLSNAAKYTDEGQVQLQVRHVKDEIHFQIRDTGIGIAPEDYEKVFTAFEQVDSSNTRTVGGTGLGLPITKWLVEMHQGRIYFESEVDRGTTFHVHLPIQLEPDRMAVEGETSSVMPTP